MPNWCANSLKIKPLSIEAEAMMHNIMTELKKSKDCPLFNIIKPMPPELLETVKGSVAEDEKAAHEAQMQSNMEKYGYPTWYEFANEEWGTKWEVCELEHQVNNDGSVTIWFDTAWSPPIAIYEKLFKMGFDVEATYCECGVGYAGWWINGEDAEHSTSFFTDDYEDDSSNEQMEEFFHNNGLTHAPAHIGG